MLPRDDCYPGQRRANRKSDPRWRELQIQLLTRYSVCLAPDANAVSGVRRAKRAPARFAILQPLDLCGEIAPLHGEIEERAAHLPSALLLRDPVAFQRIGSAVFFGYRDVLPRFA
jgi:hypothetical protein